MYWYTLTMWCISHTQTFIWWKALFWWWHDQNDMYLFDVFYRQNEISMLCTLELHLSTRKKLLCLKEPDCLSTKWGCVAKVKTSCHCPYHWALSFLNILTEWPAETNSFLHTQMPRAEFDDTQYETIIKCYKPIGFGNIILYDMIVKLIYYFKPILTHLKSF